MTLPEHPPPIRFGDRYIVSREIGRGGGAVVHLARDQRLGRQVAIKVLLRTLASPAMADRFQREVRISAGLVHTNIVQLFEAGTADGLPFFVMPFVEGETLRSLMDREPRLGIHHAIRIIREIADALNYAHAVGVVHRDIKPENILMADGHPMVADFGIAKAQEVAATDGVGGGGMHTTEVQIMGTAAYMSPEQQLGDEQLDGRSDLYSLATVLYEMLTGITPFGGRTTLEMFAKRLTEDPAPISAIRGDVTAELEAVIRRALDREPSRRFATGREFSNALNAAISGGTTVSGSHESIPSIAVLPFQSSPPGSESDYFSDGIAEGVMVALSRLRRLQVVARTSIFALKGKYGDVRELGRRLGVRWILEGTITRSGNQLRITIGLVNVADGFTVLNRSFYRDLAEAIAMQDEIAQSIVDALRPSLIGNSPPVRASVDPETYRLYLLGRHHWNLRAPDPMDRAEETFRQVIERDPDFALGHAGIADVHHSRYVYGYADPLKSLPLARDAALRAIALDPFAAEPHAALGTVRAVLDWNWTEAAAEFRRAIALDPTYSSAYGWFANYVLLPLGRFEEALAELTKARRVDPLSAHIGASFGMLHYYARRFDEADAECRAVLEFAPHFLIAHYFLGRSLVERGRFDEGIATFETVARLSGSHPAAPAEIGYARAKMGDRVGAERQLEQLRELSSKRFVSSCLSAQIHAALGNIDLALSGFELGFAEHSTDLLWLGVHPGLDEMRKDPRFQAMLRRIGVVS